MRKSLLILMLFICLAGFAMSPLLNSPRVGDRLDVLVLSMPPAYADTTNLSPTLCRDQSGTVEKMSVWQSLPQDTLIDMIVMTGTRQLLMTKDRDNVMLSGEYRPGYTRIYKMRAPYLTPPSDTAMSVRSEGVIEGISRYVTTGNHTLCRHDGLILRTPDDEIIDNVSCIEQRMHDTVMLADTVPYFHHGLQLRWYAPGYRYPILSNTADILISAEGDTVDTNSRWEYISPYEQETVLADDAVNREIRRAIADNCLHSKYYHPSQIAYAPSNFPDFIRYDGLSKTLTIIPSAFTGDRIETYVLFDYLGHVFDSGALTTTGQMDIDMSGHPEGVYLLYIGTSGGPQTYRFTL